MGTGLLSRDHATAYVIGCELVGNGSNGVVSIDGASVRLWKSLVAQNAWHGFICKHASSTSIMTCYVSDNHGCGVLASQEARVTLKQCTCTENRGRGVYAEGLPKIEYVGNGNRVCDNGTGPVSLNEAANHAVPPGPQLRGSARRATQNEDERVPTSPAASGASTTEAKHVGPYSRSTLTERAVDLATWHWAMEGSDPFDDVEQEHEAKPAGSWLEPT